MELDVDQTYQSDLCNHGVGDQVADAARCAIRLSSDDGQCIQQREQSYLIRVRVLEHVSQRLLQRVKLWQDELTMSEKEQ